MRDGTAPGPLRAGTAARPMRADARRNYDRLLAVARDAFAERGIEASLEDVARRAEVGIGTLYRHFPTRDALLEALLRERFDALAAKGRALLDRPCDRAVLLDWTRSFMEMLGTYRGLTAALTATLADETSELHASCAAMRGAGAALLARAQEAGLIRTDVDAAEFMTLVNGVTWGNEQSFAGSPERLDKLLGIVLDGLAPR